MTNVGLDHLLGEDNWPELESFLKAQALKFGLSHDKFYSYSSSSNKHVAIMILMRDIEHETCFEKIDSPTSIWLSID